MGRGSLELVSWLQNLRTSTEQQSSDAELRRGFQNERHYHGLVQSQDLNRATKLGHRTENVIKGALSVQSLRTSTEQRSSDTELKTYNRIIHGLLRTTAGGKIWLIRNGTVERNGRMNRQRKGQRRNDDNGGASDGKMTTKEQRSGRSIRVVRERG